MANVLTVPPGRWRPLAVTQSYHFRVVVDTNALFNNAALLRDLGREDVFEFRKQ